MNSGWNIRIREKNNSYSINIRKKPCKFYKLEKKEIAKVNKSSDVV